MRLRTEYSVGAELKFLSNLDMMHLMERSLRRADIPYALSEGFNPHVKLSMGTVLPVGISGEKEYFDLELSQYMRADDFMQRMNAVLPEKVKIRQSVLIPAQMPSLMKTINSACYSFIVCHQTLDLMNWAAEFLSNDSLIVKSRGKKKDLDKDLRPGIYKVEVKQNKDLSSIDIWVSIGEPVNVRYDELLDIFLKKGFSHDDIVEVYRKANYIKEKGAFYSPLEKVTAS
jgi:radical SAM-linked protein